jgi:hypothetical protein
MTIYKYALDNATIKIHKGFRPLALQMQGNTPVMWAEVDDNEDQVTLRVCETYTGAHYVRKSLLYIGTVQRMIGNVDIVSHFFIDILT